MRHVNDFYRVEQLHLLKLKAFLIFESSTHFVVVKWPVEFGFIVGSRYVELVIGMYHYYYRVELCTTIITE